MKINTVLCGLSAFIIGATAIPLFEIRKFLTAKEVVDTNCILT